MKLVDNWEGVLKRAWSIKLLLVAGVLSGLEQVVPMLDGYVLIPHGIFAALSGATVCAAFVARFLAQEELHEQK